MTIQQAIEKIALHIFNGDVFVEDGTYKSDYRIATEGSLIQWLEKATQATLQWALEHRYLFDSEVDEPNLKGDDDLSSLLRSQFPLLDLCSNDSQLRMEKILYEGIQTELKGDLRFDGIQDPQAPVGPVDAEGRELVVKMKEAISRLYQRWEEIQFLFPWEIVPEAVDRMRYVIQQWKEYNYFLSLDVEEYHRRHRRVNLWALIPEIDPQERTGECPK